LKAEIEKKKSGHERLWKQNEMKLIIH
jgi:hypothetical protein